MSHRLFALILLLTLLGCTLPRSSQPLEVVSATDSAVPTPTASTLIPVKTTTPELPSSSSEIPVRVDMNLPLALIQALHFPAGLRSDKSNQDAGLNLEILPRDSNEPVIANWVYTLVAPFSTVLDDVSLTQVKAAWHGEPIEPFKGHPLLVSPETRAVFQALWGMPASTGIMVIDADQLLDRAWDGQPSWAIVPFEALHPRWKVLSVDGMSPLQKDLDTANYPLTVRFGLSGNPSSIQAAANLLKDRSPATNRDPQKMTVLVMTGVTALVRGIAEKMEENGVTYPAGGIASWLRDADITHISNEVSFYKDCPPPARRDPRFCSDPRYIELLQTIQTNVVELTGNHLLDWGTAPLLATLAVYQQNGWSYYGGGVNLKAAREPVKLEDHGNKIAFIGCNPAGPASDWALDNQPGSASCDFDFMKSQVQNLRDQGYLVIATFQHVEVCSFEPHLTQKADFGKMVSAGAVIVSGSQAHCPQAMLFQGDQFVHYGLGNLFFDQMDETARREFIDRHIFYDGHYISTQLLTAVLENSARPRPMTSLERQKLLEDAFRASGWIP